MYVCTMRMLCITPSTPRPICLVSVGSACRLARRGATSSTVGWPKRAQFPVVSGLLLGIGLGLSGINAMPLNNADSCRDRVDWGSSHNRRHFGRRKYANSYREGLFSIVGVDVSGASLDPGKCQNSQTCVV